MTDDTPLIARDARKVLKTLPSGVLRDSASSSHETKLLIAKLGIHGVFFPWQPAYQAWWAIAALGSLVTVFLVPYQIAFEKTGLIIDDAASILDMGLNLFFTLVRQSSSDGTDASHAFERIFVSSHLSTSFPGSLCEHEPCFLQARSSRF